MAEEKTDVLTAEDLLQLKYANDPQLSPDGRAVVFVLVDTDVEKKETRSHLWMLDVTTGAAQQFTFGVGKESSPRWSPDGGQIAFISTREDDKPAIFLIPSNGGEAKRLSDRRIAEPSDLEWAPDGQSLTFSAKQGEEKAAESKEGEEEEEKPYREVTRLFWKMDGQGWWDGKWRHIWTLGLDGQLNQITDGDFDHQAPRYAPDGSKILFIANRTAAADKVRFNNLWLVDADGGEPQRLTHDQCAIAAAIWSPDGEQIAYVGQEIERGPNSNYEIRLLDLADGRDESLTGGLDHSVGDYVLTDARGHSETALPFWPADGDTVYFLATDHGYTNVYSVNVATKVVQPVIKGHHIFALHVNRAGRIAVGIDTPTSPGDLFAAGRDGGLRRLTHCNDAFLADKTLTEPERFTVAGENGDEIEAWLLKPPQFDPQKKYPLIVEIHGGPHAAYGYGWFHEFHYLVGAGYLLLFTNPHGSRGYGEAFNDSIRYNWGEPVQRDIESALDEVIGRGFVDTARLGVTGGSYGGYMTNWIVGHSDRFAAAVAQRSCSNYINLYGNDDVGHYFGTGDAPGAPWEKPDWYIEHSPLFYAINIHTPLLLVHSEEDLRCTLDQAEQLYRALRVLDREVGFVIFKASSHGLSRTGKPKPRLERLRRILSWFQQYMPA